MKVHPAICMKTQGNVILSSDITTEVYQSAGFALPRPFQQGCKNEGASGDVYENTGKGHLVIRHNDRRLSICGFRPAEAVPTRMQK
jgi:hypothetical protein